VQLDSGRSWEGPRNICQILNGQKEALPVLLKGVIRQGVQIGDHNRSTNNGKSKLMEGRTSLSMKQDLHLHQRRSCSFTSAACAARWRLWLSY
jgi:hypothetical protein